MYLSIYIYIYIYLSIYIHIYIYMRSTCRSVCASALKRTLCQRSGTASSPAGFNCEKTRIQVKHPKSVKRSTGHTHTHTTAEQTTHTNTERATNTGGRSAIACCRGGGASNTGGELVVNTVQGQSAGRYYKGDNVLAPHSTGCDPF